MSFSTAQEREDTMYKRTFKALLAASVIALGAPVAAAAMPTDHSGGPVVVQRSAPIISEKTAGLNVPVQARQIPVQAQRSAPIVSEKAEGFVLSKRETGTLTKSPIVSEKTAGMNLSTQQQPVERVVVSTSTGFDWGDAGIGAAATFASILAAIAAAGMVRRHQGHFAH
jgi:hypothetical protein